MNKSPQYNQQSKSEVEEICLYQNMESGRHSIYSYLKTNSGFHARKNPKQQSLNIVTFSGPSLSRKCIYVCLGPCSPDNTELIIQCIRKF